MLITENLLIITIVSLGGIGLVSAVILYLVSRRFKVYEDPRIKIIEEMLPQANCGGCGQAGCHGFAESCVKSPTLSGLFCPVGGAELMNNITAVLGKEAEKTIPRIAVVRCNGSCQNRPRTSRYDGAPSCSIEAALYKGDTDCAFGCLGHGDCEKACLFDAIRIDPDTGIPVVDEEKCTACGACVKACPRGIIELRKKGPKSRRIYVECVNQEKGVTARKACKAACIGCSKCVQVCPFEAIEVRNHLAYIDDNKCRLCRKCTEVCPTSAIRSVHFPPKKESVAPVTDTVEKQNEKGNESSIC